MSGIGFGTLLLAIFAREAINATFLNPWKIFEHTRDNIKPTQKPKETSKLSESDPNMTAERQAYEREKAEFQNL